jgi:hypothetical protein
MAIFELVFNIHAPIADLYFDPSSLTFSLSAIVSLSRVSPACPANEHSY